VSLLLTTQYELSKVDAGDDHGRAWPSRVPWCGRSEDCWPTGFRGSKCLLVLLLAIALSNIGFAMLMAARCLARSALLSTLYVCFGLGNGATFQLVPHRWKGKDGFDDGHHRRAAGGIGGFLSAGRDGHRQGKAPAATSGGFTTFGILAATAFRAGRHPASTVARVVGARNDGADFGWRR